MSDVNKDADEGLPPNEIVCEHGRIASACCMCELDTANDLLRRQVEALAGVIARNACRKCPCKNADGWGCNMVGGANCIARIAAWSLAKAKGGRSE